MISDIVVAEIAKCDELKRNTLFGYLAQIEYNAIETASSEKALRIASSLVKLGILKQVCFDDCQHIAAAIISECDAIVSWNFKHIVNLKTISGVKAITALEGYSDVLICTPSVIVGGEEIDT